MTREEALQILDTIPTIGEQVDALELAIEALSAEPCEDCISRDKVHDLIAKVYSGYLLDETREVLQDLDCEVAELPSIQPKAKTGHSEHKYNDAYSKGFEDGKKQAFMGYCMQCYDELSPYEQAKLMVEWGADIPSVLDKIKAEIDKHIAETSELSCTDCVLDGTDACSRGAGRAVDSKACEDFLSGKEKEN